MAFMVICFFQELNFMLAIYATLHTFITTRFTREEKGATAVEYAIVLALVAAAVVAAFVFLPTLFTDVFGKVTTSVTKVTP
jgi:pilus assembly protein Flp/PilA